MHFHTPQRHVITGHESASRALALQASGGGRLTDGMGTGGYSASFNGQDYAVVQAADGQMAELDLRALWLSQNNNLRVTVDDGAETVLQGTVLPPAEGGGRRFRSRVGGRIQVLLVTDKTASLSFVSLAVSAICNESWAMVKWNVTVGYRADSGPCAVPSPADCVYPDTTVQPMEVSHGFRAAKDEWTEGKDDLSRVAGSGKYFGGVLLPDGRVVFVPSNADRVGLYDPIADKWTEGKDDLSSVGSSKYKGGVLLPNGLVLMVPYYANHVGLYDSSTDSWREGKDDLSVVKYGASGRKYNGGVLMSDGRVLMVPVDADRVGIYDARQESSRDEPAWTQGTDTVSSWYRGGVLLSTGTVILVPGDAPHVGLYDKSNHFAYGKDSPPSSATGTIKYIGGVHLPDGRVVMVPDNPSRVGLYDPVEDLWKEGKDDFSHVNGPYKYNGGVLLPDGRVLLVPYHADHVGLYDASKEVVSNTPAWTQGKDNVSATQVARGHYIGGVLLPDGRVVLVPSNANRVGLYDAGGTRAGSAYSVSNIAQGENAMLLPYYNKL